MTLAAPTRTNFRTWDKIAATEFDPTTNNPFTPYSPILQAIEATPASAYQRMWETHEEAVTNYTAESITQIFLSNLIANKKKYDELIDFYEETFFPFDDYYKNEAYEHTRTPDLESSSESSGSGSAETERKQTRTTTTTPNSYTTTTTHSVAPFDDPVSLRNESQDIATESGSNTVMESYTGQPDETTTSTSSSSTVTTTGTDKNEYTKIIHGRTGNRPTSEVVSDGLKAAALHDILDLIIEDIANQVFLQVWI